MNNAERLQQVLEGEIAIEHAKKIKAYCIYQKRCKACVFFCGVCSLATFHPCDWDFKETNNEKYNVPASSDS